MNDTKSSGDLKFLKDFNQLTKLLKLEETYISRLWYYVNSHALVLDNKRIELLANYKVSSFTRHLPLSIEKVKFESPGFWEFFGKLNPIESIREIIRDFTYRNKNEKKKGEIENLILETTLVSERIDVLKKVGYTDREIKEFVELRLGAPFRKLSENHLNDDNFLKIE